MAVYEIKNLKFAYPGAEKNALNQIELSIEKGEFVCLCGPSGCGKTSLLRLLKSSLAPAGNLAGEILFDGKPLSQCSLREQTARIGFVMQNPDNQIVTDKVWHELAFGLESLGYKTPEIRRKVAEMASFFGISDWFHKSVTELSGGQKQLLNLASIMVMHPDILILDEPTSQLDPIAAAEFLKTLEKINRELGTSILLSEHRLEEAFPLAGRVLVMDEGTIIADGTPVRVGTVLKDLKHSMYQAMPSPMRIFHALDSGEDCPVTVREGRVWLEAFTEHKTLSEHLPEAPAKNQKELLSLDNLWFRYHKEGKDIIKGLSLTVYEGEILALLGDNGTGKTTALSLIAGLLMPYRGRILCDGQESKKTKNLCSEQLAYLPQNPQILFVKKTVHLDLLDMLDGRTLSAEEKEEKVRNIARLCRVEYLLERHPYDLSGGEQQRAALAKILLKEPRLLLLDEPTKGFDARFKQIFAEILKDLKQQSVTVIMVSHDIEFCAEYADRCGLFFDGNITALSEPRDFFAGNHFYTTATNRMARSVMPSAIIPNDIILACGGSVEERVYQSDKPVEISAKKEEEKVKPARKTSVKKSLGILFAVAFLLLSVLQVGNVLTWEADFTHILSGVLLAGCFLCLLPKSEGTAVKTVKQKKLSRRSILACVLILVTIPLTVFIGTFYLDDKKYSFITFLVILQTMLPFFLIYEGRKPRSRELVLISVLCALVAVSRVIFFMLPQFKPIIALIILAGVCFGGETGFLVGSISFFISNFYYGQSILTPWQMFAAGIIGFASGLIFHRGRLPKTRLSISVFGFLAILILYGGIMDPAAVITFEPSVNLSMIFAACVAGFPFNLLHAASTAYFLWFLAEPVMEKLERIKEKYGLTEN